MFHRNMINLVILAVENNSKISFIVIKWLDSHNVQTIQSLSKNPCFCVKTKSKCSIKDIIREYSLHYQELSLSVLSHFFFIYEKLTEKETDAAR